MRRKFYRLHSFIFSKRHFWSEELLALFIIFAIFAMPVSADTRFAQRGLFMQSTAPGATTSYVLTLNYTSPQTLGSLKMEFCVNPIPYMPCVPPAGLDVANASLTNQTGETGFSILPGSQDGNHITLTRSPAPVAPGGLSNYTFSDIVNPTDTKEAFSIRLSSHASADGTGPQTNFGSVRGQVVNAIYLQTQVPPMLLFCVGQEVEMDCSDTNGIYYTDMGKMNAGTTLTAQSQMAVGTNASDGFVITVTGTPPTAGTNVIEPLDVPSLSQVGVTQFGINLVSNNAPAVGSDPQGPWTNAVPTSNYNTSNLYMFRPGDVIATAPHVSLMRRFTVSYILNTDKNLPAGTYATTLTYIASGRF